MTEARPTTLVIPCFNEATRLPAERLLECTREEERPWLRLLMVDDGSLDDTPARLAALAAARPEQIEVLTLPSNAGKAEAVRLGLQRAAAASGDGAYVGYWDADLATPLEEVDDFVAYLNAHPKVDVLYGSRVLLLGRHIDRRPLRHYGGRVMATLASVVLGLPVYDTQCGAKLMRASPRLGQVLETPFLTRWMFDVELLARWQILLGAASPAGVHELPVQTWRDVPGSKLSPADYLRSPYELWRIHRHYRSRGTSSDLKRLR